MLQHAQVMDQIAGAHLNHRLCRQQHKAIDAVRPHPVVQRVDHHLPHGLRREVEQAGGPVVELRVEAAQADEPRLLVITLRSEAEFDLHPRWLWRCLPRTGK